MEYIIFAVLVVAAALCITITIYNKRTNSKVLESSQRIAALLDLNQRTTFHQITNRFTLSKHYDNKGNYMKIEPSYLMTAKIREDLAFFSDYISKIKENRNKLPYYTSAVQNILATDYSINCAELKLSERAYQRREEKLFAKRVLSPVVDCLFSVTMSYSSPKGKVNLSKKDEFNFDDLFTCFESVSRSHLDRKIYSQLAAVTRGEVSDSLRYDILNRDNFTCVICGASSRQGARLHVDHIVPVSKGGKSVPSNLRTLCERCNIGKSDKIETASPQPAASTAKDSLICEKCGAQMILRNGKHGEFYGCSNYPKCKFTKIL